MKKKKIAEELKNINDSNLEIAAALEEINITKVNLDGENQGLKEKNILLETELENTKEKLNNEKLSMEEQILDLSNTLNEEKSKNTLLSKDYNDCKLELSELNKLYEENDTVLKDYKMKLEVQVKSYNELEKKIRK